MSRLWLPGQPLTDVDPSSPVNWVDGLNAGLDWWQLLLPSRAGGAEMPDLTRRYTGALSTVSLPDWEPGPDGAIGLDFNGTADRTAVSAVQRTPDFSGLKGLTLWARVWWNQAGTDEHTIYGAWDDTTNAGLLLRIEPSDNTLEWFVVTTAGFKGGSFYGVTVPVRQWCTVAARFDSVAGLNVWVNAVKSTTTIATGAAMAATPLAQYLYLGRVSNAGNDWFKGRLTDCRGWKRSLSDAEIPAIHSDAIAGYPRTLNRMKRWVPKAAAAPAGFGGRNRIIGGGLIAA